MLVSFLHKDIIRLFIKQMDSILQCLVFLLIAFYNSINLCGHQIFFLFSSYLILWGNKRIYNVRFPSLYLLINILLLIYLPLTFLHVCHNLWAHFRWVAPESVLILLPQLPLLLVFFLCPLILFLHEIPNFITFLHQFHQLRGIVHQLLVVGHILLRSVWITVPNFLVVLSHSSHEVPILLGQSIAAVIIHVTE